MVTLMSPTVCVPPLFMPETCLTPFFSSQCAQFGDCHHHRIMLLRNLNRIADVIEVAVGAEHDVDFLDVLLALRALGIAHDPGVDHDGLARRSLDAKRGVAQPGEFDAIQIHVWLAVRIWL